MRDRIRPVYSKDGKVGITCATVKTVIGLPSLAIERKTRFAIEPLRRLSAFANGLRHNGLSYRESARATVDMNVSARARASGARVGIRFHAFIVHYIFIAAASGPGYGHTRISLDVYAAEASRRPPQFPACTNPTTLTIRDQ